MAFQWQGRTVESYGDIMEEMDKIATHEDARAFVSAYRETNEYAETNIGYLCGYFSRERMVELLKLFAVDHPVFGGAGSAAVITPEDALAAGRDMAERGEK